VAYGVVLGAFLHAMVQLFPTLRLGFRWRPILVWSSSFKKMLFTSLPRILSIASVQINFFIEGVIATTLSVGSLTVLRYAQDLQSFPIGIIGVSMAISSFSVFSHLVIDKKKSELATYLRDKLDHLFILLIPAAFGLYALRVPLTKLILEGGYFDAGAVQLTSVTLAYLCIGLVAAAVLPLVTRVFFAFHDTFWPFVVSLGTVALNTVLAIVLAFSLGVAGIGLASSISVTVSLLLLMSILRWKYLSEESFFHLSHFAVFLLASLLMGACLQYALGMIILSENNLFLFGQILLLTGIGVLIYGALLWLFFRKKLIIFVRSLGY
ncbi:MAG: lipid II flippase MurJ, partial [Candidatus Gracilibacteria bacterium]|nr:lipid II flippase MurJ [Candidatus Gracilibacteria bacterium]